MKDLNIIFCYFDKNRDTVNEVLGHIYYPMQRMFINELYSMKLDSHYSTKHFFLPSYFTGDLVSYFFPNNGVVDFTPISKMICNFNSCDIRSRQIIQLFFEKIEIKDIRQFSISDYNSIVRNASNSSFPQPSTYQFCVDESMSIPSNTRAVDISGYDFFFAKKQQETMDFNHSKVLVKVS